MSIEKEKSFINVIDIFYYFIYSHIVYVSSGGCEWSSLWFFWGLCSLRGLSTIISIETRFPWKISSNTKKRREKGRIIGWNNNSSNNKLRCSKPFSNSSLYHPDLRALPQVGPHSLSPFSIISCCLDLLRVSHFTFTGLIAMPRVLCGH